MDLKPSWMSWNIAKGRKVMPDFNNNQLKRVSGKRRGIGKHATTTKRPQLCLPSSFQKLGNLIRRGKTRTLFNAEFAEGALALDRNINIQSESTGDQGAEEDSHKGSTSHGMVRLILKECPVSDQHLASLLRGGDHSVGDC